MKSRFIFASSVVIAVLLGSVAPAFAQDTNADDHVITIDVPTVALLDLETSAGSLDFTAAFTKPTNNEAGAKILAPSAVATTWLNYTSIQSGTTSKKVNVKASALVDGVDIHVVAGAAAATGAGTKGTPGAGFDLTTSDQVLISDIGSAYTATGANSGHQLTYTFVAKDENFATLRSGVTPVTVTYTLADN